ncbi:PTS sugar transporter subunit IIB [uncultured Traorella sp.]|uniref:PTS sugar transporter subunit IIB n=1 Tax=uncultured Traorella sp. TaxID=1929048 RepID=UPI0025D665DE|nr:PTS sugar transporter subunit IIB [uncultured Traorella sp.]
MIKCVRIDHRLIHGQVAFSWTKFLDADCIFLISDQLMKNEIRMAAMKIAKPSGVKLVMKNIEDAIKLINNGSTDKYKLFIILESIEDAYRLTKNVPSIKKINIGGTQSKDDRYQISKAVFISKEDEQKLKEMIKMGIEIEIRLVPTDIEKKVHFM